MRTQGYILLYFVTLFSIFSTNCYGAPVVGGEVSPVQEHVAVQDQKVDGNQLEETIEKPNPKKKTWKRYLITGLIGVGLVVVLGGTLYVVASTIVRERAREKKCRELEGEIAENGAALARKRQGASSQLMEQFMRLVDEFKREELVRKNLEPEESAWAEVRNKKLEHRENVLTRLPGLVRDTKKMVKERGARFAELGNSIKEKEEEVGELIKKQEKKQETINGHASRMFEHKDLLVEVELMKSSDDSYSHDPGWLFHQVCDREKARGKMALEVKENGADADKYDEMRSALLRVGRWYGP